MQRILIDTDIGVDDALAVMLALKSQELKVEAITTVSGNVHVDLCTRNLYITLAAMGLEEFPLLAKGEAHPLINPLVTAELVHGTDGLGGITRQLNRDGERVYQIPKHPPLRQAAVDVIIDKVSQYPNELILVPIGPLTNIAKAMLKNPSQMRKVHKIVLMGGVFENYGNVTSQAEFNMFVDPHAAQLVFNFGVPIIMTPLDVTHQAILSSQRLLEEAKKCATPTAQFLRDATHACMEYHQERDLFKGMFLHDPLAIAFLTHPTLFEVVDAFVQVETSGDLTRGTTVADLRGKRSPHIPNAQICIGVDSKSFLKIFFDRVLEG